jgi:carbon storage regulator CsrA
MPFDSRGETMHVISCDENEAIVIDNRYTVRVLEILDDSVRLAIESPFEEPTYREEVIHVEPEYV